MLSVLLLDTLIPGESYVIPNGYTAALWLAWKPLRPYVMTSLFVHISTCRVGEL